MPIARIIGLCISLAVVIYGIVSLNKGSLEKSSFGAMFVKQSFEVNPDIKEAQNWTWCHTRVTKIKWKDFEDPKRDFFIHQEKMSWMVDIGEKINMAQVGMEMWLAKNCTVPLTPISKSKLSRVDFEVEIEFLDQKSLSLSFAKAGNLMAWGENLYTTPKFIEALLQLPNPPQEIAR